jgi:hypothetical protein
MITIERNRGIYTIYVDEEFYCTCESMAEVTEELEEMEENL